MAEDERPAEATEDDVGPTTRGRTEPAADRARGSSVTDDTDDGTAGDGVVEDGAAYDDVAESFLGLEADLDGSRSDGAPAEGERVHGLVTGAERVGAAAVPEGYPLEGETDRALALAVEFGDEETTAYLDWPDDDGAGSPLRRLLDAVGIQLGDLYGRRLLLERTGGYYTVVTPSEPPRSSGDWGLVVAGGHVLNAAILGLLVATGGLPTMLYAVGAVLALVVLPYATYRDAWYVRTHSDWDQGPLFWATLSALPFLNSLVGLAYLWSRRRATFLGTEPSLPERARRRVRSVR